MCVIEAVRARREVSEVDVCEVDVCEVDVCEVDVCALMASP